LQLWQAFLLVCILSGFGVTAYQLHRTNRLGQIDEELERRVAALAGDVRGPPPFGQPPGRRPFDPGRMPDGSAPEGGETPGPPPNGPGFPPPWRGGSESKRFHGGLEEFLESRGIHLSPRTLGLFLEGDTNDFYFVVWSRGGNVLRRSTNAPAELPHPGRIDPLTAVRARMRDANREAFQFTEIGECVLAGRSILSDLDATRRFAAWLVAAGGAVLALGLGGGWLLASRALRPLADISAAASRISAGNLSERINVADTDSELGRLAGVLNSTFARLEAAFAQQKQFTADASHELRTPIAVLISEAQTTLARDRSATEYRETVGVCLDAAQQMRRLTQSLLELARYDAGQESLDRCRFDLAEQTRACIELVRPLARERGIHIHADLAPAEALGDADRLSRVITNLLTNAIDYNHDRGEVRVATRVEPGAAVVTVSDGGRGISADDLPHVFERFYRADRSRARAQGHSGLGLAISKAIVDAHGGSLEISSQPGAGTVVVVKLPLP
jgi:heavy metal sensor kinase